MRIRSALTMLALAIGMLTAIPSQASPDPGEVIRLEGAGRVETAVRLSQHVHPASTVETVVIATAGNYPDALSGAVLAVSVGGPLLLSASGELPPAVEQEISRLGANRAILLGGTAALSPAVADALTVRGLQVERIYGSDRFATALAVADRVTTTPEKIVVVTGENFPDAVSASAYAAANGWPVILTPTAGITQPIADYLSTRQPPSALVVGGTSAVSDNVVAQINSASNVEQRLSGPSRFATSYAVAAAHANASTSVVWLATGMNYPDALSAGAAVAATGGVLLLTPPGTTDVDGGADARGFVENFRQCEGHGPLNAGVLVGGRSALSSLVGEQLFALLNCEPFPQPCHPAYPTLCIPPPPPQLSCDDVGDRDFTVDHTYGDPHGFDEDGDGIGCETEPPPPSPSPSPSPTPSPSNCHPAYPDFCIPPPPPDLNCSDFSQRNFTVLHQYGDPHQLDRDKNGVACES